MESDNKRMLTIIYSRPSTGSVLRIDYVEAEDDGDLWDLFDSAPDIEGFVKDRFILEIA